MAGTALIQVTRRWRDELPESRAVEAVVEHETDPATRDESSATTSALMWNSGNELKQRSSAVRS